MNNIICKTIFQARASWYSDRLALSSSGADYSYSETADAIARYCGQIATLCKFPKRKKVVVAGRVSVEILIAYLALLKEGMDIVIVHGTDEDRLGRILAAEAPALILCDFDIHAVSASCPVMNISELKIIQPATGEGYQKSCSGDSGVSAGDASTIDDDISTWLSGFGYGLYNGAVFEKTTVSPNDFQKSFDAMEDVVQQGPKVKYLFDSEIQLAPFLMESMWCLFHGVHVLYFPSESSRSVLPDQDQFPMDFSLFFFGNTADEPGSAEGCYDLVLKSAVHADRNNYSGIWTPERHFNGFGGRFPNPSILSAAIAVQTKKVQIRTGSIVAPLHPVIRIAEDWSVIDNLSGGRGALSFASGWHCNDFVFYPERFDNRHTVMLEMIRDFKKLWAGESLACKNGVGKEINIHIYPKPVQKEMPIWVTVSGKTETFIDAGSIGANILTHLLWQDPADLVEKIRIYRDTLGEHGFDPSSRIVSVMLHTYIGEDIAEVRKKVEKPLKEYIRSSWALVETMVASVQATNGENTIGRYGKLEEEVSEELKAELLEMAFERFFTSASLLGDPSHCREIMKMLQSYGVDELACLVDFGLDSKTVIDGLDALNTLKEEYSERQVKRYGGCIHVRKDIPEMEPAFN